MPQRLQQLFKTHQTTMSTRQDNDIYKRYVKTYKEQRIIEYRVAKYWNSLPNRLKLMNKYDFRKAIKEISMENIRHKIKEEYYDRYY